MNLEAGQQSIGWRIGSFMTTETEFKSVHDPVCNNNQVDHFTGLGVRAHLLPFLRVRFVMPSHHSFHDPRKTPMLADQVTQVVVPGTVVRELGLKKTYFPVQGRLGIAEEKFFVIVLIELETGDLPDVMHQSAGVGCLSPRLPQVVGNGAGSGGNPNAVLPQSLKGVTSVQPFPYRRRL